jgi:hypothetical protein
MLKKTAKDYDTNWISQIFRIAKGSSWIRNSACAWFTVANISRDSPEPNVHLG